MGLASEPLQGFGVSRHIGEKFQSDLPVQADIFRLVDHPHAAGSKLLDHPVVRNGLAVPEEPRARRVGSV